MMAWKFNNDAPIYSQIIEEIKLRIAQGKLKPGDKVPPVRDLALKAGVNPNTMQKALSELEREGVLYSQRTAGRFVAEHILDSQDMKKTISIKYTTEYLKGMRELEYSNEEIIVCLKEFMNEEEK